MLFIICSQNLSIETDGSVKHSLCPALGMRHGLVLKGLCPMHLQNLFGKELNVSYTLSTPYSMPSPVGGVSGSDFQIIKLLTRKYGFIPRFIYKANSYSDDHVSCLLDLTKQCAFPFLKNYRFQQNNVS